LIIENLMHFLGFQRPRALPAWDNNWLGPKKAQKAEKKRFPAVVGTLPGISGPLWEPGRPCRIVSRRERKGLHNPVRRLGIVGRPYSVAIEPEWEGGGVAPDEGLAAARSAGRTA
jgi:hypothetical protein